MNTLRAALCITLIAATASPAQPSAGPFDVVFLPVHGRRQDTVFYDFTGDGVLDVLNTSIDYDATPIVRWLALHKGDKEKGWPQKPDFIWPVHATAAALAFGNVVPEGGVDICTLAPDGVYYHTFENGAITETPRKLVHVRTFFSSPSERALPIWSFAQDLSGEGRDDLIVPTSDGYRVYFQTAPGSFGKVSRLETESPALAPARFPEQLEFVASLFSMKVWLPRLAVADVDGDGRQDLVTVSGNVIQFWFQKEPQEFRSEKKWTGRHVVPALEEELRRDSLSYMNVQFADVDGDKLPDLIVTKLEGQVGLFESLRTRIYVCFGSTGRGNYSPNLFIAIHGVSIDPLFIDMDKDGTLDLLSSRLRTDIVKQGLTQILLGDLSIDYEVFQFDKGKGRYSESPVYSYPVRLKLQEIEKKGASSRPLLFVTADLTGDGRPDQVRVEPKSETLEVHPGRNIGGTIDFDPTPHKEHKLERYPKFISFWDVNADGLEDIVLHYGGMVGLLVSKR